MNGVRDSKEQKNRIIDRHSLHRLFRFYDLRYTMGAKTKTLTKSRQEMRQIQLDHLRKDMQGDRHNWAANNYRRRKTGTREAFKL